MKRTLLRALLLICAQAACAAPDFFVEADVDTTTPWVQSQATLRLRFFQGADARDIELAGPPARLADILPLGNATVGEAVRDGRRYRVHERHFAILPFASGRLELAGAAASGRLPGSSRRSRWPAPAIALDVRPAPAGNPDWLPARELRLTESWSAAAAPAPGQLMLRNVRIEATGVAAAQLPAVRFSVAGASVLARPPRIETRIEGRILRTSREQDFEILPTRAGSLVIPPLQLAWWKVGAGGTAVAQLPKQIFDVAGAPALATATAATRTPWLFPMMGLALLLFAARLLLRHQLLWKLWLANLRNDASALKACLLELGERRWENDAPVSLIALADRQASTGAARALRQLDAALYGKKLASFPDRLSATVLLRIYLRNA